MHCVLLAFVLARGLRLSPVLLPGGCGAVVWCRFLCSHVAVSCCWDVQCRHGAGLQVCCFMVLLSVGPLCCYTTLLPSRTVPHCPVAHADVFTTDLRRPQGLAELLDPGGALRERSSWSVPSEHRGFSTFGPSCVCVLERRASADERCDLGMHLGLQPCGAGCGGQYFQPPFSLCCLRRKAPAEAIEEVNGQRGF